MTKCEKLTIRSDGTGAGTIITVGGIRIDDVRSLIVEVPKRQAFAKVTMEVGSLELRLNGEVVKHGDWSKAQIGEA